MSLELLARTEGGAGRQILMSGTTNLNIVILRGQDLEIM